MKNTRHEKYFLDQNLKKEFKWIDSKRRIKSFIPSAMETWCIDFKTKLEEFEYRYNVKKSEKKRFEEFVFDFYEVHKGRHQVIFCWRETQVIFIVFETIYN